VPDFQYPQFCAVARAAEIIGERWTLLLLRELFFGPKRFVDLRRQLSQVSPSVLSERLGLLESQGIIRRRSLEPPAASTVYELTEDGRAFGPALVALARWGMRFLLPIRTGDQVDEGRFAFMLQQFARTTGSPSVSCLLRVTGTQKSRRLLLTGGAAGTAVTELDGSAEPPAADVIVEASALDLLGLLTQSIDLAAAEATGRVRIHGDRARLAELPQLFEIEASHPGTISLSARTNPQGEMQ
jgi:DNA-binding HxlR family transcriptional regulator